MSVQQVISASYVDMDLFTEKELDRFFRVSLFYSFFKSHLLHKALLNLPLDNHNTFAFMEVFGRTNWKLTERREPCLLDLSPHHSGTN